MADEEEDATVRLLERARAGDQAALDELFERHFKVLERWATGRLPRWARGNVDTSDLLQETMLETFKRLDGFEPRGRGALQAYLRQAFINRLRNQLRRAMGRPVPEELDSRIPDDARTGGAFTEPNRLINNEGLATFDPREFKLIGVASVPRWGGVSIGAVYRYTSGQTWARRATIRNLNQGFSRIWMEPRGSRRLPAINNLDLRVEKLVALGRSLRLSISADVFNVTNQGVPNSDVSFPVNVDSGPFLGVPTAWVDPRLLRLGIRVTF